MVDKRRVKKGLKQIQRVKTWQLVILLILNVFVSATLLRINNVGMVQRREAVHAADKVGTADDIKARLYDLRRYAAAHMNASTGPVYLQDQYNRDVQAAIQAVTQSSAEGESINAEAEAVCKPQFSGWSTAYMQCFLAEIDKHPTSDTLPEPVMPVGDLYKYEFLSPVWTPDFAGWSVVVFVLILLLIIARVTSVGILRLLLKRHYRGV